MCSKSPVVALRVSICASTPLNPVRSSCSRPGVQVRESSHRIVEDWKRSDSFEGSVQIVRGSKIHEVTKVTITPIDISMVTKCSSKNSRIWLQCMLRFLEPGRNEVVRGGGNSAGQSGVS